MTQWQKLIQRYAGTRKVCNCGEAYYTEVEEVTYNFDWGVQKITQSSYDVCQNGCQSNRLAAREFVAARVLAELEGTAVEFPEVP